MKKDELLEFETLEDFMKHFDLKIAEAREKLENKEPVLRKNEEEE